MWSWDRILVKLILFMQSPCCFTLPNELICYNCIFYYGTSSYHPTTSDNSVDPISQVRLSSMLCTTDCWKLKARFSVKTQQHNVYTKFHPNSFTDYRTESYTQTDRQTGMVSPICHAMHIVHRTHNRRISRAVRGNIIN
jgi:hypothetical protein